MGRTEWILALVVRGVISAALLLGVFGWCLSLLGHGVDRRLDVIDGQFKDVLESHERCVDGVRDWNWAIDTAIEHHQEVVEDWS